MSPKGAPICNALLQSLAEAVQHTTKKFLINDGESWPSALQYLAVYGRKLQLFNILIEESLNVSNPATVEAWKHPST
jgi:hypothetical protein